MKFKIFVLLTSMALQFCGEPIENPNLTLNAVETQRALRGNGLLIDMRPKADYDRRHICGAMHITDFRADNPMAERYVVVYGSGERDGVETRAFVRALRRLGYSRAFAVAGGFPTLLKADFKLGEAILSASALSF